MEDPQTVVAPTKSPLSTTSVTDKEDQIDTENVEKTVPLTDQLPDSPVSNANRTNKPRQLDLNNTKTNHGDNKLSSNQLENIAIQIVSPGLPPLSSEMSKMVLKSKSIAQQQKKLIAERNGVDVNEIEKQEILVTNSHQQHQQQQSLASESSTDNNLPKNNNDEDHDLVIPSPKKLKRDKLPTPLNIINHSRIPNPLIRSAPLMRNNRRKPILRYHNLRHLGISYNPYLTQQQQQLPQQQPLYYPNPYYPYFYPPLHVQQQQQQLPLQQQQQQQIPYGYRPIQTSLPPHPISTNRVHFLNRNGGHATLQSSSATASSTSLTSSSASSTSTLLALASVPAPTTPSSATNANNTVIDVYPTGVMKEAPIKAQPLSAQHLRFAERERQVKQEEKNDDDHDDVMGNSDVESIAIEETLEIDANSSFMEISGEIRLNDDLFHYNLGTTSDLQKDRERFLKICSTAWDEFAKMP